MAADAAKVSRRFVQCCPDPPQHHVPMAPALHIAGVASDGAVAVLGTNALEHLNGSLGHFIPNVRRWRDGQMLVRWIAAGLQEARRSFRRLRGHADLPTLIRALDQRTLDSRKEVA